MINRSVGIYIWQGKGYLPVQGQFDSGIWVDLEPVYMADLTEASLISAIEQVLAAGHLRLPEPTTTEWQKRKDPVLSVTKARSWKALARNGTTYSISWTDKDIRVNMSKLDEKGRWQFDGNKLRLFPTDTDLQVIVNVMLEDIQSRPELL